MHDRNEYEARRNQEMTERVAQAQPGDVAAFAALPIELRRLLELRYLEGWSQRELALLWNVPHSTIQGRLDAGRRQMRKELENMEARGTN